MATTRPVTASGSNRITAARSQPDHCGHGASDVRGHLLRCRDLGQRVRQLEQRVRFLGLAARVLDRGGRIERGGDQPGVRLQHHPLLGEEPAGRVDRGEPSVAAAVRLHVDDQVALVGVTVPREELAGSAFGFVVADSARVHVLVGGGK